MKVQDLHGTAVVCDCHQEMLDEYVYQFLLYEDEAINGVRHIFDEVYLPVLKQQGVNFVNMVVGGDHHQLDFLVEAHPLPEVAVERVAPDDVSPGGSVALDNFGVTVDPYEPPLAPLGQLVI